MTEPVTLHDGYYRIDVDAWLAERVGPHHDDRSRQLRDFTRHEAFDQYQPAVDVAGRLQLWCAAHDLHLGDGALIEHDDTCLTKAVTIVLAAGSTLPREALALVSIDGAAPEVFADATTDDGYWRDAATITISCPGGHTWTSDGDSHLYGDDGSEHRAADLYGPGRVISRCRDCAAYDDNSTDAMCPCPGVAVYCPACDQRCQVGLPQIPRIEDVR
ncbi:hypothetical protein ACIA5C_47870 [Actinoplanes sp. NPDC051343]|uniref:hypothetical protein n=1 Tax=Actinoplanes sp. NPDC051343 TaxID=3363906 RepID=UPI00378C67D8